MKHERLDDLRDGQVGRFDSLLVELDRVQFNERIAHLQRRARLQRRLIERLARREEAAPFADLQAMIRTLEEIEERNLVLEDVVKTARAQIAGDRGAGGVLASVKESERPVAGVSDSRDAVKVIHAGRLEAERLRAEGNYKGARRLLRRVRCRKALAGSGLQLLAASRYRVIRGLFAFYRYRAPND